MLNVGFCLSNVVVYQQLKESNQLKNLFTEHAKRKAAISRFCNFADEHDEVLAYFKYKTTSYASGLVNEIFNEKNAMAALNADYWSKVIGMTDVLQSMPAEKRNELNTQIHEHKTPDFTPEIVLNTIESLMLQRGNFLADKVDGLFQKLSRTHVTNKPMAFGERMIITRVCSEYQGGYYSISPDHRMCEYIDDLRSVIAQLMGRDWTTRSRTYHDLFTILRDVENYGQWQHFDGGAFSMKVFKNGNAHFDVNPEIALKLNEILAAKHPGVIASAKGGKYPKSFIKKHMDLKNDVLDFETCDALSTLAERFNGRAYTTNPKIAEVLEWLGGHKTEKGAYVFDYDATLALRKISFSGMLPEKVSHQFYPTPEALAKRLVDEAGIDPTHRVLEPSAGHGGIAEHIECKELICVEIAPESCAVLQAKNIYVKEGDFLEMWPTNIGMFDRIVMNPPFTANQARDHVNHALEFLKPGGLLCTILPASMKDKTARMFENFSKVGGMEFSEVIEDQFNDTSVSVVILKVTRKG